MFSFNCFQFYWMGWTTRCISGSEFDFSGCTLCRRGRV